MEDENTIRMGFGDLSVGMERRQFLRVTIQRK